MLDRPIPFRQRLHATWPPSEAPNAAIDHMLRVLAAMPQGSQRVTPDMPHDRDGSMASGAPAVRNPQATR